MQSYTLLEDRLSLKAGTILYKAQAYDFGLARDDTRFFGVEHWSMTQDPKGDYPFTTVPVDLLAEN